MKFPTPHRDKLIATLLNEKLPRDDQPLVEKALQDYHIWISHLESIEVEYRDEPQKLLHRMVSELNGYRLRLDLNLIFDSPHDWLYRQKGQTKLDNSIIEEFLPRLVQALLGHKLPTDIRLGPVESLSAIWFESSLTRRAPAGGLSLRCEWLDMKPINTGTTPIDKVLILRKAKRISAATREKFSTYQGRQSLKETYLAFLQSHPYREEVFQLFINYIDQCLSQETLDEETVLDQGYF
uniref:Uncharacterized protein n=1 Tax=Thermogemmatispora argillosa TaxID=2045280 RepID=A0A455T3R7_9CHLR|nr:hypothetical protein KTA_22480 [Thermogemmatispora argillosa]